jgi:hypothetical protein
MITSWTLGSLAILRAVSSLTDDVATASRSGGTTRRSGASAAWP